MATQIPPVIDQILDAVFQNELADLIPGSPGLTTSYSALGLQANGAPPRIVIFPTTGRFEAASSPGGITRFAATGNPRLGFADTPRVLRLMFLTLEAHCWGTDRANAETLMQRLIRGFYNQAHQSFEPTGLQWVTQQRPDWLNRGELVVVTLEVQIPITDKAATATKIAAVPFDQTGASPTGGILTAGEP